MKRSTEELRRGKPTREEFLTLPRHPISLVLTGLKMENLGSVFRVGDAAMIQEVLLCGVPYTPDSLRFKKAAKGTQRWVPHAVHPDVKQLLQDMKSRGVTIVALEQCEGSFDYRRAPYRFPAALVLGREREGVDEEVLDLADLKVEIPMMGMANSLNVAVAAGIMVYQMLDAWQKEAK